MSAIQRVAVRALDYLPTWKTNVVLTLLGVAAVWFYGVAWWNVALGYALGVAVTCAVFGWLDVANEDAEAEPTDTSPPPEEA